MRSGFVPTPTDLIQRSNLTWHISMALILLDKTFSKKKRKKLRNCTLFPDAEGGKDQV
jgi:hypothetical protein